MPWLIFIFARRTSFDMLWIIYNMFNAVSIFCIDPRLSCYEGVQVLLFRLRNTYKFPMSLFLTSTSSEYIMHHAGEYLRFTFVVGRIWDVYFCRVVKCCAAVEPRHEKTRLRHMRTTKTQISLRSLISTFVRCLDSIIPLLAIAEILRF